MYVLVATGSHSVRVNKLILFSCTGVVPFGCTTCTYNITWVIISAWHAVIMLFYGHSHSVILPDHQVKFTSFEIFVFVLWKTDALIFFSILPPEWVIVVGYNCGIKKNNEAYWT